MVSSRYHALVTSMPGGVVSLGVTMDERIDNLLTDRGDADLVFGVEDDDLGERVIDGLRRLVRDEAAVRERTLRYVASQLRAMGEMGIDFVDEVERVYPELPRRDVPRTWEHHLPGLSPNLQRLLDVHDASVSHRVADKSDDDAARDWESGDELQSRGRVREGGIGEARVTARAKP
jgi:hypothetical protein